MRAPYQILLFPFIEEKDNVLYALFKREDMDVWQGIAGGGENDENPLETAKREASEEGEIPLDSKYMRLSSIATVPVVNVCGFNWGEEIAVIPEYSFGVQLKSRRIKIGHEHTQYEWLTYDEALKRLKWDSNRTALWELNHRLTKSQESSILKNIDIIRKNL